MLREVSSSNIPFWRWSLWIKKVCPKAATIVYGTCLIAIVALNVGLHLVNSVYQAQLLCRLHNQEEWRDGISVVIDIYYRYSAVLWIRDILIRIRMWIFGSVPLSNESGYGSGRPNKNQGVFFSPFLLDYGRIRSRIRNRIRIRTYD